MGGNGPDRHRVHDGSRGARPRHRIRRHGLRRDRGITLGGGVGYLVRKHGLTIDDLLAAEIRPRTGSSCGSTTTTTPTCSGRSAAAVATSASPPASSSGCTSWIRSSAGCCCSPCPPRSSPRSSSSPTPPPRSSRRSPTSCRPGRCRSCPRSSTGRSSCSRSCATPATPRRASAPWLRSHARRADRRHGQTDAVPRDLSAGGRGVPPARGGSHDVPRPDRPRRGGDDHEDPRVVGRVDAGGAGPRARRGDGPRAGRRHGVRPPLSKIMVNLAAFYEGEEDKAVRERWVEDFVATLRQNDIGAISTSRRRGRGARPGGVPGADVGRAGRDQGAVRPDQPVPASTRTSRRSRPPSMGGNAEMDVHVQSRRKTKAASGAPRCSRRSTT